MLRQYNECHLSFLIVDYVNREMGDIDWRARATENKKAYAWFLRRPNTTEMLYGNNATNSRKCRMDCCSVSRCNASDSGL